MPGGRKGTHSEAIATASEQIKGISKCFVNPKRLREGRKQKFFPKRNDNETKTKRKRSEDFVTHTYGSLDGANGV